MTKDPFKEYIKASEPDKASKSYAWSTAIGLQAVDGLKPSKYLVDIAIKNIEGEITMTEAQQMITDYYRNKKVDIDEIKPDFETTKPDIGAKVKFKNKTLEHIETLKTAFGYDKAFGRTDIIDIIGIGESSASELISKLLQAEIIEPIPGQGKGKYKFKR